MSELTEFLLARIAEDEVAERGGAPMLTSRETAARIRANVRRLSLGGAWSVRGGQIRPAAHVEAQRYADHPDYRAEWAL